MKRDTIIIGVTLLIMFATAGWQAIEANRSASRDQFLPALSSQSANRDGAKAAYMVVEELGRNPLRWGRSFAQLKGKQGTLVATGSGTGIDEGEVAAIKQWLSEGNTVLAFGDATHVFDLITRETEAEHASGDGKLAGLSFTGFTSFFVKAERDDKVIVRSKAGVVGIERAMGKGTAYLFADSQPMVNEFIGEQDNAALLTLTTGGTVYFDDYHRGHVASGSPLELLPDPLRVGLLLALLVGVIGIIKQSFRFGPFEEPPLPPHRSGAQIAWSLSRLLRHAGANSTAADEVIKAFKADTAIPQTDSVEAAFERLSAPRPELEARVRAALSKPNDLTTLVSALAELRSAIKDEARGRYIK